MTYTIHVGPIGDNYRAEIRTPNGELIYCTGLHTRRSGAVQEAVEWCQENEFEIDFT